MGWWNTSERLREKKTKTKQQKKTSPQPGFQVFYQSFRGFILLLVGCVFFWKGFAGTLWGLGWHFRMSRTSGTENFMEQKESVETGACLKATAFRLAFWGWVFLGPFFQDLLVIVVHEPLAVSCRKGVVARLCQSDLALGDNAADPKQSGALRTPAT